MAWQIDPYHTQVEFAAKHLGMMTVRGHFAEVTTSGHIDPHDPAASSVEVSIKTASLKTNNEMRDKDLGSSNFLEVEKYPAITFKSTSIKPEGHDLFKMTGDLTIKDHTHPVTLSVLRYGEFNDPGRMGHRMAYSAEAEINRKDFGMTMSAMLDGKWIVSDDVKIMIELELVERKLEQPAGTA